MKLTLKPVPANLVYQVWDIIAPFIESAFVEGAVTEYGLEHAKLYLTTGQWLAVGFLDDDNQFHGAATISFANTPNARVALCTAIGGKSVASPETLEQLKTICRAHGATTLQAYARESAARLWCRIGFEKRAILVETTL